MSNTHHSGNPAEPVSRSLPIAEICDRIHYASARVAALNALDFRGLTDSKNLSFGISLILSDIYDGLRKAYDLLSGEEGSDADD